MAVRPVADRISVADLDRMIDDGAFSDDDRRLELLDGALVEMSPQSPDHTAAISALTITLARAITDDHRLVVQGPLDVGEDHSRPEPDFAITRPPVPGQHPSGALLVIEVSISSLRMDLGRKAQLYAQAGVPDYWVVDVDAREIAVHRDPVADRYRLVRRMIAGEIVEAADLPVRVAVDAVFAGVA